MAYFKLTLLTPYSLKTSMSNRDFYNSIYFEDLITEFNPQLEQYQSKQHHPALEYDILTDFNGETLQDNIDQVLYDDTEDYSHPIEGYTLDNPKYDIKKRKFLTAFSYNEKITFSQNAQKTLTFSMNRYVIRENERLENPFVNLIQTGSQLLLTDQYGNEYFFTVTTIKYTIKETNIIYDYTCQDSFTYQTSRQNQEYFIDNDPTSADFIGPKTADWWIVHKVVPECYLSNYSYIPCSRALYENTAGEYILCDSLQGKNDVKRVIKESHVLGEDNYYTTFAYSCTGQNAASVLIDIASKINMQLKTFEHAQIKDGKRTKYFDRYFWIEPLKNDQRIGLVYSPRRDIQSFDLTHNGQSLTTVMTVTGPTYEDEIITLIPDIPLFFHNYFLRPDWNSVDYSEGMFTQACTGQSFFGQDDFTAEDVASGTNRFQIDTNLADIITITESDNVIALLMKIHNKDNLFAFNNDLYEHFTFFSEEQVEQQTSQIQWTTMVSSVKGTSTPRSDAWVLVQAKDDVAITTLDSLNIYYPGQNFINNIDKNKPLYLCLIFNTPTTVSAINYAQAYIKFFRDVSQEELEFASIADKCPWLENKIIDFNYFYKQNIISRKEYNELINILYNDLRKVNGKLIYYTQAYYKAIHDKTEMLANLTNQLDSLGAAAQAAIIDPLATTGKVKDVSYFVNAYNTVFNTGEQEIMGLLNYNSIISDYFTKYFNAQQRFLKNIYNFRKFFNTENPLHNKALYRYILSIPQPSWSAVNWQDLETLPKTFYGFANNKFISLNNGNHPYIYYVGCQGYSRDEVTGHIEYKPDDTTAYNYGQPLISVFLNENGRFSPVAVASKDKWTDGTLYQYPNFKGEEAFCQDYSRYNEAQSYLKTSIKVPIEKNNNGEYYWEDKTDPNKHRLIASRSTRNYYADDLNNNSLLCGLYKVSINEENWVSIFKAEKIVSETIIQEGQEITTDYLYLTQIHQGEWNNAQLEIFTALFPDETINFQTSAYKEINYGVDIQGVYLDSNNTYQPLTFNNYEEEYHFDAKETSIGLVSATLLDLKDNWIYTHFDSASNVFIKEKPFYRTFTQDSISTALNEFYTWASVQMFAFVKQDITLEDLENSETKDAYDDENPLAITKIYKNFVNSIYYSDYPITDFYVKTPRYRVTKRGDDDYIFERLNEKNQSFTKYLEYVFNDSDFVLSTVENPYSFEEYQKLNLVTKDNESQFYRRVINHPNAGVASGLGMAGAGIFLFGPAAPWAIPVFLAVAAITGVVADKVAETRQHWDVTGVTSRNFYGEKFANNCRFSGFRSDNVAGESIYALTENSFGLWKDYMECFKESFSSNTIANITNIGDWESVSNLVWETTKKENDGSITLNRPSSIMPFYYALYDQHIGYDLQGLLFRDTNNPADEEIRSGIRIKARPQKACFIDRTVKALQYDSIVNKHDDIFMLWMGSSKDNILIRDPSSFNTFLKKSFSAANYYPLVNNFQKINISSLNWLEGQEYLTLEEIISNDDRWEIVSHGDENDFYIKIRQTRNIDVVGYAIFFRITDYQQQSLSDYYEKPDNLSKVMPRLFDIHTLTDFNFLQQEDIVKGFYIGVDITKDRVPANIQDKDVGFKMDEIYYTEDGTRIFTIKQLIERGNYVYLHNFVLEKDEVGDNINIFNVNLSQYDITYGKTDTKYYIASVTEKPLDSLYQIEFELNYTDTEHPVVTSEKEIQVNDSVSIHVNLTGNFVSDISGLSNGTFWYLYHTSINMPVLFSTAASIEAELTGYWNEAYTASKFCEYFLPESWTPTSNQKDNLFSSAIFTIKDIGHYENDPSSPGGRKWVPVYKTELIDSFLPNVQVVRDNNGKTVLKKYQYVFQTDPAKSIQHFANTKYVLEDQDIENISSTSVIQNNFAIRNAMKVLYRYTDSQINQITTKWLLTEIGHTTYYYAETGGTPWAQLVQQHVSSNAYIEFDGWYLMALRWLKRHYQNWDLIEYEEAKQEHDNIWNKIYQDFGHILLENSFASETATTSTELLNEALLQFKDRATPERQYSITVIDTASLENYSGTEIRIGDGIQVKATDYYDQQDLIYDSLTQYLFITDIGYTLRDATNFSLTVNDVKYADTIIKRLAKLVK